MSKSKKNEVVETISTEQVANVETVIAQSAGINHDYAKLLETHKTKSAVIRFLVAEGHKYGPVSKFMGIKYQFVRNVMIQPLKKTA